MRYLAMLLMVLLPAISFAGTDYAICYDQDTPTVIRKVGVNDVVCPAGQEKIIINATTPFAPHGRRPEYYRLSWTGDAAEITPLSQEAVDSIEAAEVAAGAKIQRLSAKMNTNDFLLFRMALTIFKIGVAKGLWTAQDVPADLRADVVEIMDALDDAGLSY